MGFFSKFKVANRLLILISCVLVGFTIYGLWSFKTLNDLKVNGPIYKRIVQGKDLVADILPPPEYIIESYLVSLQLMHANTSEQNELIQRLRKLKSEYDLRHVFWQGEDLSNELKEKFLQDAHHSALDFYKTAFDEFLPVLEAGDQQQASQLLNKMRLVYEKHRSAVDQVVELANKRVANDEKAAQEQITSASIMMLAVLLVTLFATVLISSLISHSITRPLVSLKDMITKINEHNDFTLRVNIDTHDEIGETSNTFDKLISNIQDMLRGLLEHANQLSSAAHSLSTSSLQVAASSRSQSDEASYIVSNIDKVNVSIRNVTKGAQEALKLSKQSGELSNHGGDIIQSASQTMMQIASTVKLTANAIEALGQQSNQISSVVQVIKDVADQTNLLALNAAIEAARAGEQGRGFAVVADEVRNLAKRTTKATEEISQMISAIQDCTQTAIAEMGGAVSTADEGSIVAAKAGDSIDQIKAGSSQVVNVVNDISQTLLDQNDASDSIGTHISKVACMAEENMSAAEISAKAAVNLAQLADDMRATVNNFRL
jgi:methyl-accepting chemotaxis protein